MSQTPSKTSSTLAYTQRARPPALADTVAAPATTAANISATLDVAATIVTSGARATVLPRVDRTGKTGAAQVVVEGKQRYEVMRHLGAGGQADVTLARDHDIDRTVAVKRLRAADNDSNDSGAVLRFAEEVRTVGQLEHPNIVPIHDVGVDESGQYFFVMKYVEGETLESVITKLRDGDAAYLARYTPEYRIQICNEILRGVEHAHSLGILHRDLKPANVMIGALGEVVVMDWGLAKKISDDEMPAPIVTTPLATTERERLFQTQAGALLGTPAYMSPEQAAGRVDAIDARSDVYSLAVMFHELFSLRHPRANVTSVAEMLVAVNTESITALQILSDFAKVGAPPALAHFVRHGLAREASQRYQTVAEMRERLEAIRDGKAPIECHVTFTQAVLHMMSRTIDRHPFLLMAVFAAMTLAMLAGIGSLIWQLAR